MLHIWQFLTVYLAPAVPAIITFLALDPDRIKANTSGTIAGFTIKFSGGVGAYVVFTVLAITLSHQFFSNSGQKPLLRRL
jgi:hypothetical protein